MTDEEDRPASAGPGHNRLKALDPEKLLLVEIEEIAPLLGVQYPALVNRRAELLDTALAWAAQQTKDGALVITSDAEMNRASDVYVQLATFAGDTGEAEETRKRVKLRPWQAIKAIDAWFANLRDVLTPHMAAITKAQNARAEVVRKQEEVARQAEIKRKQEEAQALLEAARKADADEATVDAAIEAETAVELAKVAAAAPITDLTRTRSAMGTTTSQSENWTYKVTSIKDLCAAVVAGKASDTFVVPGDAAIRLAIRGKNGKRDIPGLEIYPEYKMNRRGAPQ